MKITRNLPELHDRVRYTGKFLKSIGAYFGEIPERRGVVTGDHTHDAWVMVLWDDETESTAVGHDALITLGVPDYTNM